eukprot:TCALIF_05005-PA protein Name:"Protein of unknown function" AED:0.06 eAED:0.06 QI:0/-1/0/1/-1/1/1/0/388
MIPVPRNGSEVTKEWLQNALEKSISDVDKVEVNKLEAEDQQESGYLSSIFRGEASIQNGTQKQIRTFIKVMPQSKVHLSLINTNFMDVTEVDSYNKLFPDLIKFEREHSKDGKSRFEAFLPECYAGGYLKDDPENRAYYLILANQAPEYQMRPFNDGLSYKEVQATLIGLAYFHAWTYCMKRIRKFDCFSKEYPFMSKFFNSFDSDPELVNFVNYNLDLFEQDLKGSPIEDHLEPIRKLRVGLGKKYADLINETPDFLIHGDIWGNNCMFSKNARMKIVDWQFTTNGNPFLDLGTIAFISMAPQETEVHVNDMLNVYFEAFTEVCTQCQVDMPWSHEIFMKQGLEQGLILCLMWSSTSYEFIFKYPSLKDRIQWVLKKAVANSPHFFK